MCVFCSSVLHYRPPVVKRQYIQLSIEYNSIESKTTKLFWGISKWNFVFSKVIANFWRVLDVSLGATWIQFSSNSLILVASAHSGWSNVWKVIWERLHSQYLGNLKDRKPLDFYSGETLWRHERKTKLLKQQPRSWWWIESHLISGAESCRGSRCFDLDAILAPPPPFSFFFPVLNSFLFRPIHQKKRISHIQREEICTTLSQLFPRVSLCCVCVYSFFFLRPTNTWIKEKKIRRDENIIGACVGTQSLVVCHRVHSSSSSWSSVVFRLIYSTIWTA